MLFQVILLRRISGGIFKKDDLLISCSYLMKVHLYSVNKTYINRSRDFELLINVYEGFVFITFSLISGSITSMIPMFCNVPFLRRKLNIKVSTPIDKLNGEFHILGNVEI